MADLNLQSKEVDGRHSPTIWGRLQYWLFEPAPSIKRQDDRRQARLLSTIQFTLLCLNLIAALLTSEAVSVVISRLINVFIIVLLISYSVGRTRHYQIAALILVFVLTALPFAANTLDTEVSGPNITGMIQWTMLGILLGSMFFSFSILIVQVILNLFAIFLSITLQGLDFLPLVTPVFFIFATSSLIIVAAHHRNQMEKDRLFKLSETNKELQAMRATLEERVADRTRELQKAYETIQAEHERLLQSEKMASLGRLTGGIAHEINTPLAASRAALAEMSELTKEYQDALNNSDVTVDDHREIGRELLQSLKLAGSGMERIAGFVHSIKSQVRDEAPRERVLFNAVPVIRESLLLVNFALQAGNSTVTFESQDANIELYGLPGQLSQIITNLMTNAIDASADKGGGPITLHFIQQPEGTDLVVRDQGSGISSENLPRIFDLLFTTKPSGHGTGLGLVIVRDILTEVFDGTIDVNSQPGQGTTFTLHFPRQAGV
jgi:signal transduction histidine kinase